MNCTKCQRPIVATFQPDKGDWQRVFTVVDGQRCHVPPCPAMPMTPATETGD
jgi:hypothetical protein